MTDHPTSSHDESGQDEQPVQYLARRARRSIVRSREWWVEDMAAANAALTPFAELRPEDLTPEIMLKLHNIVIQELGHLALTVRELALEPAPRSTSKPRQRAPRPKPEPSMEVSVSDERVKVWDLSLTAEQAREVAFALLQAAEEVKPANLTDDGRANEA